MATTRKTAAKRKPPVAAQKTTPKPVSPEEKQAMVEAYHALSTAGCDIPEPLLVVEDWIREVQEKHQAQAEAQAVALNEQRQQEDQANRDGPWYVRNLYQAPFNLRLDRQTEKRRVELKPCGTPGDMHPLKDEDLKDPVLKQNLALGIVEIIPAGVAARYIEKQTTNMSERVHTPLAMLRNELDQPYKQGQVKMEAEFNSQGVTVAQVEPGLMQGQLHDKQIGGTRATGGLTRVQPGQAAPNLGHPDNQQATSVVHSGFVPTGGNPAAIQMGNEAHARAVDDLARRKGTQGPQAGLGDVQVVVEPVRKT